MSASSNTSLDTIEAKLLRDREQYFDSAGSIRSINPMDLPVHEDFPEKINNRWVVSRLLGAGAFGCVYEGVDTCEGISVAIKMASPDFQEELKNEARLYKLIWKGQGDLEGFSKVHYSGIYEGREVLVMEHLGQSSVKGWMGFAGGKMSLKSVFMIGLQMIDRLQHMHERGIVHRDVKPENMLFGKGNGKIVYMVDFGLAAKYIEAKTGQHVTYEEDSPGFVGTPDYASMNAHKRATLSRRDDLESLAYSMIHMHSGELPWMHISHSNLAMQIELIGEAKSNQEVYPLCNEMGLPMVKFIQYVWDLKFEQDPDYDHLRELLLAGLQAIAASNDTGFDWCSAFQK